MNLIGKLAISRDPEWNMFSVVVKHLPERTANVWIVRTLDHSNVEFELYFDDIIPSSITADSFEWYWCRGLRR